MSEKLKVIPDGNVQLKHTKYIKPIYNYPYLDVYAVCEMFDVKDTSGAVHHAIKKLLCAGQRGSKGYIQDLTEARDSIDRKIALLELEAERDAMADHLIKGHPDDF